MSDAPAPSPAIELVTALARKNPRWATFALGVARGMPYVDAHRAAGYTSKSKSTRNEAYRLTKRPEIAAAISALKAEVAQVVAADIAATADEVLRRFWAVATADPNELVEYRRTCCRYCYGEGHGYQRTPRELAADRAAWEKRTRKAKDDDEAEPFDEAGGTGWDPRRDPAPDCPECFGEGVGRAYIHDTRKLSEKARMLFAGVKETQHGIEVKLRDQDGATVNTAKLLGLYKELVETRDLTLEKMLDELEPEHEADGD